MLKNYIITTLRFFKRNPSFSFLNIAGLSVGIAASILILFWVVDEISYDRFHKDYEKIYRVYEIQSYDGTDDLYVYNTPGQLAPYLREHYPSLSKVALFTPIWQNLLITKDNEHSYYESEGFFADKEILDILTFDFIAGQQENALAQPYAIVLTEELAKKFFGDESAIGKSLTLNKEHPFTVTGVVKPRGNSIIQYSFFIPFEKNIETFWQFNNSWTNNSFFTYAKINDNSKITSIEEEIKDAVANNGQANVTLRLEPLKRSRLYTIWPNAGTFAQVRFFSIIAFLILLIACINFMNLSTARSSQRAKEVGLRKVVGSNKRQLIGQFLGESALLTLISLILALLIAALLLPKFNEISGKNLSYQSLSMGITGLIGTIAIITALISGSYPAFFLSSFNPVKVLKGSFASSSKQFRTILVVIQFTLASALIVGTLFINKQLAFLQNMNLGYNKENIVYSYMTNDVKQKYDLLKNELQTIPNVELVTASNSLPNQIGNSTGGIDWEGRTPDTRVLFTTLITDFSFTETYGMQMVEGRSFNQSLSDTMKFIVNEEAVRVMGMDSAVGKTMSVWGVTTPIIGVVKNFNYGGLKQKVQPLVMTVYKPLVSIISIKLSPSNTLETMEKIEAKWKEVLPDEPFTFSFFDKNIDNLYRTEKRISTLFTYFSALAIVISCLGLFGLANFMAEQKFKEIGIRKTLGASTKSIVLLLIWQFTKWVIVANAAGWIVSYYAISLWLREYPYKIDMTIWPFIISAAASIGIAMLTILYQSVRAAKINPVDAIKYE
ncbi:MAG: ABC transporter permease [Bacteroidales bacterium]|nr:ABC transporter permease [Bacteroidales bacterium]MBN2748761.1 ABC transporter permease [Bacteroidales bacterium]